MDPSEETGDGALEPIQRYRRQAEQLLTQYGREFAGVAQGRETLVQIGDSILSARQATGYNILPTARDMAIDSSQPLIFYSNYIGRTEHIAELLGAIEQARLMEPEQVRLGVKASRVLYGGWEVDEADEQLGLIERETASGELEPFPVEQTVETVVTFAPADARQVAALAEFLVRHTSTESPEGLAGSWKVPDIRATSVLAEVLGPLQFAEVRANVLQLGQSRLLVARQVTDFPPPWQTHPMAVNAELTTYLAWPALGVSP